MFECAVTTEYSMKCITAKGRIDALSSSEIREIFDDLILAGERTLLADMTSVHYISSAGLREFIVVQKELKKVGGEIILFGFTDPVLKVFKMGGLDHLFRTAPDKRSIPDLLRKDSNRTDTITREMDGIAVEYVERDVEKGFFLTIGSQDRTGDSSYTEQDVVAVQPAQMKYGCGLAALGDTYDEYKHLFGEAMVTNDAFFFYPAVKRSSVDFLIDAHQIPGMTYKFLHGFGFNGNYRYVLSFEGLHETVELHALIEHFFNISGENILGVSIIAESKGLWGMNLRRVPVVEQKPANGKSIFDSENFPEWIDFPVEPSCINNIVVATGIAVRDRSFLGHEKALFLSEGSRFHLHGGVFEKAPLGKNLAAFDKEVMRIFNERQVHKIQHILGHSRFSRGMAAIVEIGV